MMDMSLAEIDSEFILTPHTMTNWKSFDRIVLEEDNLKAFPSSNTSQIWLAMITGLDTSYIFSREFVNSKNTWGKKYKNNRLSHSMPVEKQWELHPNTIYEIAGSKTMKNQMRMFFMVTPSGLRKLKPLSIIKYFDQDSENQILPQIEGKDFSEMPEELKKFSTYI